MDRAPGSMTRLAALICLARRRSDITYAIVENKTYDRTPSAAAA
ncbi:hypothetical protein [Rhodococcus pseudokoreensis]|nr:hypothetical protein [Rhodococcus pseudokoreensis]